MTSNQTCTSRNLVAAIRRAYRPARPGYSEVKPSVEQLLRHLVVAGVVPPSAVLDPRTLPIEVLEQLPSGRCVGHVMVWKLSRRFSSLGDLAALNFGELLAEAGVSAMAAKKIERALASLSVLLKDGDPKLLRRALAPAIEKPRAAPDSAPDPEHARATCARALLLLAKAMMNDGASLTSLAAQLALEPDNARRQLKMYAGNGKRTGAAEVARIAAPIISESRAATPKRRKGRRAEPAASENVVPVVFGGKGIG